MSGLVSGSREGRPSVSPRLGGILEYSIFSSIDLRNAPPTQDVRNGLEESRTQSASTDPRRLVAVGASPAATACPSPATSTTKSKHSAQHSVDPRERLAGLDVRASCWLADVKLWLKWIWIHQGNVLTCHSRSRTRTRTRTPLFFPSLLFIRP